MKRTTVKSLAAWSVLALISAWGVAELPRQHLTTEGKIELLRAPNPLSSMGAARVVAAAMAGSRTGSLAFGGYCGFALAKIAKLDNEVAAQQLSMAVVTAAFGLLLAIISLWIERMCVLPETPESEIETVS